MRPDPLPALQKDRIQSVDLIRLIAITAVIAIHTEPFRGVYTEGPLRHLEAIINQIARFAVPFFFVISGYFYGTKVNSGSPPLALSLKTARRLILLFLAWSATYLLMPSSLYNVIKFGKKAWFAGFDKKLDKFVLDEPLTFLFRGGSHHLWFFISLMCAVVLTGILLHLKWKKSLILISVMLYLIGIFAASYSATPLGIDISFNTRNGPFFSTLFFVSGYFLSQQTPSPEWLKKGLFLMVLGYAIQFSEIFYLYSKYQIPLTSHEYVFGTFLVGLGAATIALSNHPSLHIHTLSRVGIYTLGIYAVHRIFVDWLRRFDNQLDSPLWEIGYIFIVLILSIVSVTLLAKIKPLKKLLM